MRLASSILALLVIGVALPASAADDESLADRLYITVGAGYSFQNFDDGITDDYDDAPSGGVRIGFEVLPILDTELQYDFGGRFDDEGLDRRVNVHALTGNVKLRPIAGVDPESVIQPYALVGFGWVAADLSSSADDGTEHGWAFRGALGIEVPLDQFMSFYTEGSYVFSQGDADEWRYAQVGAGFVIRFSSGAY